METIIFFLNEYLVNSSELAVNEHSNTAKPRNRRHVLRRAGVALSEKYSRFTVPFACIRGNVVERRPYTAAPVLPRNGEIFRELSWDSRQNGN